MHTTGVKSSLEAADSQVNSISWPFCCLDVLDRSGTLALLSLTFSRSLDDREACSVLFKLTF